MRVNQLPGGNIVPRYVLKPLSSEKIPKLQKTKQPLKLEKNKNRFEILRILEFFDLCLTKLKNNKILPNKISH
jgi:hypothetical protein